MNRLHLIALALVALTASCGPPDYRNDALAATKSYLDTEFLALETCAQQLQTDAPTTAPWTPSQLATMRTDWRCTRDHYEHIEGAIAVLFPDFDVSVDARYDDFLDLYGQDDDPFDDTKQTGMHMIERVLFADVIPMRVVMHESALTGYVAARMPATNDEAMRFKTQLCRRLVDDVHTERTQFAPLALDPDAAYRGVIGSMHEQIEKIDLAATGEEESRYSQQTLADMQANLAGGVTTYGYFASWVKSTAGGDTLDATITAGFARLSAAYDATGTGAALPPVPTSWDPTMPSTTDAATPYGVLHGVLVHEADPDVNGTLVHDMNTAGDALGIPLLPM